MNLNKFQRALVVLSVILITYIVVTPLSNWLIKGDIELCIFKRITGHECPGCGMTRAFSSVLKLNFAEAMTYNNRIIIVFPMVCIIFVQRLYVYLDRILKRGGFFNGERKQGNS